MEYVLDIAKWRCGGSGTGLRTSMNNKGDKTSMLDKHGNMCCLGQFAEQMGVEKSVLFETPDPMKVSNKLGNSSVYDPAFLRTAWGVSGVLLNSPLATTLMHVNDNRTTSLYTKVNKIRHYLEGEGHSLKVVNGHLLEKRLYRK